VQPGVDVHVYPQLAPCGNGGRTQPASRDLTLDVDRDHAAAGELREPTPLTRTDDRVGNDNIAAAGGSEDLSLGHLGDHQTHRSSRELLSGDGWRLVRLGVGTKRHASGLGRRLPALDVGLHDVKIDEQRGRLQLRQRRYSGGRKGTVGGRNAVGSGLDINVHDAAAFHGRYVIGWNGRSRGGSGA
jgi:hypothetical protein